MRGVPSPARRAASDSVVCQDITARTQNGHIRNDTRVASRRIRGALIRPICRKNCVASDRACTPVTPGNLHGKEGVDGSSPSEGSAKAPQNGAFCLTGSCTTSSVQWVWSPLWSLQVQSARSKASKMGAFAGKARLNTRPRPAGLSTAADLNRANARSPVVQSRPAPVRLATFTARKMSGDPSGSQ